MRTGLPACLLVLSPGSVYAPFSYRGKLARFSDWHILSRYTVTATVTCLPY